MHSSMYYVIIFTLTLLITLCYFVHCLFGGAFETIMATLVRFHSMLVVHIEQLQLLFCWSVFIEQKFYFFSDEVKLF